MMGWPITIRGRAYHAGQLSLSGVQADVEVEVESSNVMGRFNIDYYKI